MQLPSSGLARPPDRSIAAIAHQPIRSPKRNNEPVLMTLAGRAAMKSPKPPVGPKMTKEQLMELTDLTAWDGRKYHDDLPATWDNAEWVADNLGNITPDPGFPSGHAQNVLLKDAITKAFLKIKQIDPADRTGRRGSWRGGCTRTRIIPCGRSRRGTRTVVAIAAASFHAEQSHIELRINCSRALQSRRGRAAAGCDIDVGCGCGASLCRCGVIECLTGM
jgi:hypothetical protein